MTVIYIKPIAPFQDPRLSEKPPEISIGTVGARGPAATREGRQPQAICSLPSRRAGPGRPGPGRSPIGRQRPGKVATGLARLSWARDLITRVG